MTVLGGKLTMCVGVISGVNVVGVNYKLKLSLLVEVLICQIFDGSEVTD